MKVIQLYSSYYQNMDDKSQPGIMCYGWAPLGKKPTLKYYKFDRVNVTSFDLWYACIIEMLNEIGSGDLLRFDEEVTFELVVHETLSRNEYRSIQSLLRVYHRMISVEIDDVIIQTAKRLVVKGKAMTSAMRSKQKLIAWILKNKQMGRNYHIRYNLIKYAGESETKNRFVTCYDSAMTKAQQTQNNIIEFPNVTA